jgi:hypothetical protein
MGKEIDKSSPVDCYLDNYENGLREKIAFLRSDLIPLVIIARALRKYIKVEYSWEDVDIDCYLMKCNFAIAEEMNEDQIEKAIGIVCLMFDVQMVVFSQIGISSDIVSRNAAGIQFEMGSR